MVLQIIFSSFMGGRAGRAGCYAAVAVAVAVALVLLCTVDNKGRLLVACWLFGGLCYAVQRYGVCVRPIDKIKL